MFTGGAAGGLGWAVAPNVRGSLLCMCTKEEGNLQRVGNDIFSNMKQSSDKTLMINLKGEKESTIVNVIHIHRLKQVKISCV